MKFASAFQLFVNYAGARSDSAMKYAKLSLMYSLKLGDSASIAKGYHALGDTKTEAGDIQGGIKDMELALHIARRNGYLSREKFVLNNLAIAHTRIANYDIALDYNIQSLKIREQEGDYKAITISYNNIGLVYLELNDFENAQVYFQRAIDLKKTIGDENRIEIEYINLGYCLNGLERYSEAVEVFLTAFEKCGEHCDQDVLMRAHNALGIGYLRTGSFNQAETQFLKSISLSRLVGSPRLECVGLRSMAEVSLSREQFQRALNFMDSAQAITDKTDLNLELLKNHDMYSQIYAEMGDYEKSSEYQKKYIELNKNIYSGDLIQKISRIQTDYEEQENLKTIASKNQVLKLQGDIIARQKSEYAFIITITFLVMGLALVMYRANQSQRKTNQQLAQAKETIQHQNELLSNTNQLLESEVQERTKELFQTNESLTKVNEEMDNFIYKTSHDIRGPLATLKGMCNVAMVDVKDELALTYLKKLDTSAAKLNAILSRLLIINQINHSLLNPEYIKFEDQIEEIIALEAKKGLPARMKFTYDVEPGLNFRSDKEMTCIILENLIDNAIKFYNDSQRIDPFVHVRVFSEGQHVVVKVTDNGIGIDESSKDKIFNLFVRASERSDSGGIGLYLSKLASTKLGGTIELTPTSDSTTQFTVTFPRDLLAVLEERRAEELKREKQRQNAIKKG